MSGQTSIRISTFGGSPAGRIVSGPGPHDKIDLKTASFPALLKMSILPSTPSEDASHDEKSPPRETNPSLAGLEGWDG